MARSLEVSNAVIAHLVEISGGRCSIADELIAEQYENDPAFAEILMGLRHLHEDLELREELRLDAEAHLKAAVEGLENRNGELREAVEVARAATREKSEFLGKLAEENRRRKAASAYLDAVVGNVVDGIVTIDEQAIIRSFNQAAERIFGYGADHAIGQNVKFLMPEPFHSHHDQYVGNYLRTGQAKVIGIGREVVGLRSDGTEFPMELAISSTRLASGERMFVGIIRDITERKQHENQLEQQAVEARLLHQVTTIVTEAESFEDALKRSADAICQATGWPIGHAYLPSARGDILEPSDIWSIADGHECSRFMEVTAQATFVRGIGLPGRVWESGRSAWICDVQKDTNFPRATMCTELGVRGAFGFAVKAEGAVVAILEFFTEREMEADQHLLFIVESIGGQMGRVLERRHAEDRLREALDAAETANQAKTSFLSNMSHELRTPLNSVIGFARLLLKNKNGHLQPKDVTFLNRIDVSGRHLLHLINQILDLSKIEAGRTEIENRPVSLDLLIQETVKQLEGQVDTSRVKLLAEIPQPTVPVVTDPDRLKQVLINLIGNAIKFTEEGLVTVRLGADPSRGQPIWIDVEDTGIGIPKDRREVIFEAFRQADTGTERRYGGTGLGLTISMSLLKLLGFDLTLESVPGRGSTFRISLPNTQDVIAPTPVDRRPRRSA